MTHKPKIIALSASLRNARWGKGIGDLIEMIKTIKNKDELMDFAGQEAKVHLDQFVEAGRKDDIPFDDLYKNLRKLAGKKGLCNSEVGMVVALWAAYQVGCDIDYVPLSSYFGASRDVDLEGLREKALSADAILLCTPVYFGDRSSLASDFIEFVRADQSLCEHLAGKPVAGVAVGAKRNGGQETTLIYQLLEMTGIGMLGVGNDSDTTSQYGGTILAGDIGTAIGDSYGLATTIGVGRRLAHIALSLHRASDFSLRGKLKVMFWILQDEDGYALERVRALVERSGGSIDANILDLVVGGEVGRCIACDICPTHVGPDVEYRCIVKKKTDKFVEAHEKMLDYDVIVPVALSKKDRKGILNVYQRFIERTRYLRRGDYLFSDVCVMPLVIEEIGASEYLDVRMLTSLIRQHTVMSRPAVAYLHKGEILNWDEVCDSWDTMLENAKRLTLGRLSQTYNKHDAYNPVGYILSAAKDKEISVAERREVLSNDREIRRMEHAAERVTLK
ncbi:NAD(P)H-dependent oxidoreductase [Porticoccus sp.]|nr:NAD(P)H-dependent oxidoreductase [Porticoccus sp.]